MTQVDALIIHFVLPNTLASQEQCSDDIKLASELVIKLGGKIEWKRPSDFDTYKPQKKDVFVFDKFEGPVFEKLKSNSSKHVYVSNYSTLFLNIRTN